MADLDVFIKGELINLCIPTREFALGPDWYKWFNQLEITKYLYQGIYPNTQDKQLSYFESNSRKILQLIIQSKEDVPIGVISLNQINEAKRTCDISIVADNSVSRRLSPYINLEAMSLMSEHGIERLGMSRISAGQHIKLNRWQQRLEILGYKLEGIHSNAFIKGSDISDTLSISLSSEDYHKIKEMRGGQLWDGLEKIRHRIKALPPKSYFDALSDFYENERRSYYNRIFDL